MDKAPNQVHKVIQAYYIKQNINRQKVRELYTILSEWDTRHMSAEVFLLLLTKEFQDPVVRSWAVANLDKSSDHEIEELLLQATY